MSKSIDDARRKLDLAISKMAVQESIDQVKKIKRQMDQYGSTFEQLVEMQANNAASTDIRAAQKQIFDTADSVSKLVDDLLHVESEIAHAVRSRANSVVITVLLISAALSLALGIWLVHSIMKPLRESGAIADALSSGDLRHKLKVTGDDEFAQLNRALMTSTETLRNMVENVVQALSKLETTNQGVVSAVQDSTQSITEQQLETDQLATALEELAASTTEIAASADEASASSSETEGEAKSAENVVQQSRDSMKTLSDELIRAATVVTNLEDSSKNIASIMQVIEGIAEQTNLLALNAAIEAARAGDKGRGFAVVADEVRQLAQRTQDSTSEINQIITTIQQGAGDVVGVIESANQQSTEVENYTNNASTAYANIIRLINNVADLNARVSVGATEQSQVSDEVSRNVLRIKQLADDNSTTLQNINKQTKTQAMETENLKKLVSAFKI